jgi:hypothetical protein
VDEVAASLILFPADWVGMAWELAGMAGESERHPDRLKAMLVPVAAVTDREVFALALLTWYGTVADLIDDDGLWLL